MSRRVFLKALPGVAITGFLAGCASRDVHVLPPAVAHRHAKIRGIAFDLFTLFDPRSVVRAAEAIVPSGAAELCDAWRTRQFEYAWLRASAGTYVDFEKVTDDALVYAATTRKIDLSQDARRELVAAYSKLDPWPDTRAALLRWKAAGLRLAPLANYAPSMIERLVAHAGISDMFDALISTDAAKTYKPDPRAYELGEKTLGLSRGEIAFSAFGGWDAAGAKWFGYPTFWVNRLGVTREELAPGPDGTGPTLAELARFIDAW